MSKINVGIDINEILRAKWLQFDKYYEQEFGEEGIPSIEPPYVYDFFKYYGFKDTVEVVREMREPENTPEHINPLDYVVDEKGEAPADFLIFKKSERITRTAKEVYNRFMYEDYLFEIHGSAPMMYRNMDLHMNSFYEKYSNSANFTLFSVKNKFSIPPTLFFLSKISSRFKNIKFVDEPLNMWEDVDVLITTDPSILNLGNPWSKKLIKVKRPYNKNINTGQINVGELVELIDNNDFEKIIKYKKQ